VSLVAQLQHRPFRSRPHTQRWRPPRRRRARLKTPRWLIAVLLGLVAMGFAAVTAWILAGGSQVGLPAPLSDWLPSTTPSDTGGVTASVRPACLSLAATSGRSRTISLPVAFTPTTFQHS
jgi:hypothetical protein